MRPKFNARAATVLTAAGALTMTMIAATRAPASAPAQPDSTLAMTITDRTLGYGQSLVVSGRAAATSAGRRLVLEYRPRGRDWGPVASTTAGADGRFRFRVRAERSGDARVRVADGAAATRSAGGATPAPDAGAAGPAQTVSVAGRFVGRWRSVDVDAGRVAVVRGALRPAVAGRTVTLERPGHHALARATTARNGSFVLRYRTPGAGSTPLRLRFRGDGGNAGAYSRAGVVNAYRSSYASWYEDGGATACGFHAHYGVAHRTLPCGTRVAVYANGRIAIFPVVDRGPHTSGVSLDLTKAAAARLRVAHTTSVRAGW